MNKREWLVLLLLALIAAGIAVFDGTRGKAELVAPRRPVAVPEDILELRFHPDKYTFSHDPATPGKLQTGPFNVSVPIVCSRTHAGSYKCTSTTHSSACDEHKCEETEVVTSYFPEIKCDTHHHRGRPHILLDSCYLAERKPSGSHLMDYIYSILKI
jgi:hypothetical protein